jgi:hypothetical protein
VGYASWSQGRRYRWILRRAWPGPDDSPELIWIMLNPSTAGAGTDDQTVRRCVWYSKREGCSSLAIVNLFALVATDPRQLLAHPDPVGWLCDAMIIEACTARAVINAPPRIVVVAWGAWGAHPKLRARAAEIQGLLDEHSVACACLGLTSKGHPVHPSRQRRSTPLRPVSLGPVS